MVGIRFGGGRDELLTFMQYLGVITPPYSSTFLAQLPATSSQLLPKILGPEFPVCQEGTRPGTEQSRFPDSQLFFHFDYLKTRLRRWSFFCTDNPPYIFIQNNTPLEDGMIGFKRWVKLRSNARCWEVGQAQLTDADFYDFFAFFLRILQLEHLVRI